MSRHSVRIFSLRYRKSAGHIFREKECNCDDSDGIHGVGDIWHAEVGNEVWVRVAVDYFATPASSSDLDRVSRIFDRCELDAECWIHSQYPELVLQ